MSINSLLTNPGSKPWADLYVDSLTCYSGLTVNNSFEQNGDLVIHGKLTLDNTNNSSLNAIEITGNKAILTDGFIKTTTDLEVGNTAFLNTIIGSDTSVGILNCQEIFSQGDINGPTLRTNQIHLGVEPTDIQRVTGNTNFTYTCQPYVVSAASQPLTIRAIEYGNLVHFDLLYDGGLNAVANEPLEWAYPVVMPTKYIPTHNTNHVIYIVDSNGISLGVFSFNNTNGTFVVRRFNNNTFESFVTGQPAELAGTQSISFHK